jgi:creatinine amidohydrolase
MRLDELTTTEAEDVLSETDVALLPTGSTEQHGPGLPLGTDTFTAEAVVDGIEREDTVILPTIPVGRSDHHRQFPGTLWVEDETFERYIREMTESIASHGVRRVIYVNGHGGNDSALIRAARTVRRNSVAFATPWKWFTANENANPDVWNELFGVNYMGHADHAETSNMMALAPELVHEDALEEVEAEGLDGSDEQSSEPSTEDRLLDTVSEKELVHGAPISAVIDTLDFAETGAWGRPTRASPEAGEELIERAQRELNSLIDWLAAQELDDLLPTDHK